MQYICCVLIYSCIFSTLSCVNLSCISVKQSKYSVFKAKVAVQADIDCMAELADFLRFNSHYAKVILERFSFKDMVSEMT